MPDFKKSCKNAINNDALVDKHAHIKSFNAQTILSKDTRYLIVGTLTPCQARNPKDYSCGYFYCGEHNLMYEFIDGSFDDGLSLVKAKEEFKKDWKSNKNIKDILNKRRIAFLDVIKEAIVFSDSTDDNDIYPFIFDIDAFRDAIPYLNNLKVVANSKNAKEALKLIFEKLNINKEIEFIPQSNRWSGLTKNQLQEKWKSFFCLYNNNLCE